MRVGLGKEVGNTEFDIEASVRVRHCVGIAYRMPFGNCYEINNSVCV